MSILGTVASLYMMILIILLIISFGLIGLKFINYITIDEGATKSKNNPDKSKINNADTSKWLKAALYSFLGLVVSMLVMAILNSATTSSLHM